MIKSVIWSSMIDYPDNICSTLFLSGCNFNCEFCYNKDIYMQNDIDFYKDILPKLIERKNFISHIIISGGECTISPFFNELVNCLYENEFKIGIHTNGYSPEKINAIISKLDFIGMDIKNDFNNYSAIARYRG